ncbi:MAG TPA: indole-3-glycerol phosphate synthase TrpC [Candidatus Dormibacteraeota bacterium]|jgi:indole-3-glycerol phosphate synthase|nr:indole-3-glycerol phosphate synthase TrpC [Candidatus Dormibacteraeota bacterium]
MNDLLRRLVDESLAEVERRRARMPEAELERLAAALPPPRDLVAALRPGGVPAARSGRLAVIAEMKARTPIAGELSRDYAPARLASRYARAGASALSVLCQETSFGGRPEHLAEARAAAGLPVLRKDFVVTEHQVLEGRAYGADAVLLIVAALEAGRLRELLALARRLGMEALVEVHDERETALALEAGAGVVGVNHRDLTSFEVDLGLTERLRPLVPAEVVLVAESGIRDAADARRMREAGADAILVGEALMRAADPEARLEELRTA